MPTSATAPDHFLHHDGAHIHRVASTNRSPSRWARSKYGQRHAPEALPEGVTVTGGPATVSRPTRRGSHAEIHRRRELHAAGTCDATRSPPTPTPSASTTATTAPAARRGPSGSSSGSSGGVLGYSSSSYKGPYAVVAKIAGLIDNHHYAGSRAQGARRQGAGAHRDRLGQPAAAPLLQEPLLRLQRRERALRPGTVRRGRASSRSARRRASPTCCPKRCRRGATSSTCRRPTLRAIARRSRGAPRGSSSMSGRSDAR